MRIDEHHARSTLHGKWMSPAYRAGLVTIVVPTYNRAHVLCETLDSAVKQTYRPIEIIVVDDGSTDGTDVAVAEWKRHNADQQCVSFRYLRQENAGVCAARNRALIESSGEFIQFLDSDDLIHPDRMRRVVSALRQHEAEYIETGFDGFCSSCGTTVDHHPGHIDCDQMSLLLRGRLWPNTLRPTYRRSLVWRTGPWNESMVTLQDYEYVIRAFCSTPPPKKIAISDILAYARRDTNGRMSDLIKTHEGRRLRIDCEELLVRGVSSRHDMSQEDVCQFASRLYALAFRSAAAGWPDLARRCGELADSLDVPLDILGTRRRMVYLLGAWAGKFYEAAHRTKQYIGQRDADETHHICSVKCSHV